MEKTGKRRLKTGKEEEGLLLILPSLSHRPFLHRLFPPPPLLFLLHSILGRLHPPFFFFPVQRNAARATILELHWHKMEAGRPVCAGNTPKPTVPIAIATSVHPTLLHLPVPPPVLSSPPGDGLHFNSLRYVH